ncbi:MAG TPA: penicillin-insensitive murein endopeptidase [Kofleriaceae bacterium]
MRAVLAGLALAFAVAGCAELGVVTDGSSVSYGKPSRGYLIDGVKLPDRGDGFTTREMWSKRGNRYGTDELVGLIKGVAKRMRTKLKVRDVRLVVADLSGNGGGAATLFHRSHQTGRDVDILYYTRDALGKPLEPQAMVEFTRTLAAKDESGVTVDIARTWLLVKELLTADEAMVQYIFMYQPIAQALIEHAQLKKEDPVIIARAIKACRQPGDSAPHNDHMHVRIYCPPEDRHFGCVDIGPLELLAEREADKQRTLEMIAAALPQQADEAPPAVVTATQVWAAGSTPAAIASTNGTLGSTTEATMPSAAIAATPPATAPAQPPLPTPAIGPAPAAPPALNPATATPPPAAASFGSLLRARADRIDLRGWR